MKDVDGCRVSEEDEEMDRQLQCALQMSLEQNVSNCGVRASEIQDGSKVTVVQDHFDCHTITKRCEDNVDSSEIPDKGAIVNDKPTSELSEGPTPELSESSSNDVVDNSSQIRKQREQFLKRFDK
ncbi:unnamed protein product [Toxocara canis]|nr:unnamed protein product [Toxocara canis]